VLKKLPAVKDLETGWDAVRVEAKLSLFDLPETEEEDDTPAKDAYTGSSISWYGLMASLNEHGGGFCCKPLWLAILMISLQICALNGMMFMYEIDTIPDTSSLSQLLDSPVSLPEKVGVLATILAVPIMVLAMLAYSGEFFDSSAFLSALVWYTRHTYVKKSLKYRALLVFWLLMHAARSFFLVPLYAYIIAKILAQESKIDVIFIRAMTISFLLQLDHNLYAAFHGADERATRMCTVLLGVRTKAVIHNIQGVSMYVLFGVQLVAALYLKHESTLYSLYIIPITGALLCAVSLYQFPTRCTFKIVLASGLFAVYLIWFASMYCLLVPGACPDTVPISMFSPSVEYKAELKLEGTSTSAHLKAHADSLVKVPNGYVAARLANPNEYQLFEQHVLPMESATGQYVLSKVKEYAVPSDPSPGESPGK
jgi:hypothetical protein